MRTLRSGREAVAVRDALALFGYVPTRLHHILATIFARKGSLVVTNVPGPAEPLHLAGREIAGATFGVPHPTTLGLGVSILNYAGAIRVCVRADVAVLPDPAELVARIEEQSMELAALAPQEVTSELRSASSS
jgi:diacylglycerol O-acyltransferase